MKFLKFTPREETYPAAVAAAGVDRGGVRVGERLLVISDPVEVERLTRSVQIAGVEWSESLHRACGTAGEPDPFSSV